MKRRKVLLGTPVRGDVKLCYLHGLVSTLTRDLGVDFEPTIQVATYVNVGRNNLVDEACAKGCDEILFWDYDMEAGPVHAARLLSHDVDIVGAVYPKRVAGEPQWTVHGAPNSKPDENGLQEANDIGTGLLRIRMRVFDVLKGRFPQRFYQHAGDAQPRFEAFPIGLCEDGGHRHPAEAKLEAIRTLLTGSYRPDSPEGVEDEILAIIERNEPRNVHLVGEDVQFCRLAKAAGFKIWADTRCLVRHRGEIGFPAQEIPL